MDISDSIRADIARMADSSNTRFECPFCAASHEQSFTVRREATRIWFRCWRASCGVKGSIRGNGVLTLALDQEVPSDPRVTDYEEVPTELFRDLSHQYDISRGTLLRQGMRYDPHEPALCLPLNTTDAYGALSQQGWQKRRTEEKYIRNECPKGMTYLAFPRHPNIKFTKPFQALVLVENLLSAYKVEDVCYSEGIHAAALLGHTLRKGVAEAVSHYVTYYRRGEGKGRVVLMLDPDTWPRGSIEALKQLQTFPIRAAACHLVDKPHSTSRESLLSLATS